jgi:hypothetical protein
MNLRKITTRAAIAGATTALAAGALVGATGTAANAATVSNVYTCTVAGSAFDTTVTVSGELPVPQYWAGAAVPPGLLPITVTATVDPGTAGLLSVVGVTHARSDDFALPMVDSSVPVPVEGDFVTEGGNTTWEAEGVNEAFTTPDPGTASALMPSAFTLTAEATSGDIPVPCTLKEGETAAAVATIDLLRQSSATAAPAVKAKVGKKAKLNVSVTSTSMSGPVAGGKVVVKEGKKTLGSATLKNGKAKVNLGKLKKGKHKLTVTYSGIPSVNGSSVKTTVTVKK